MARKRKTVRIRVSNEPNEPTLLRKATTARVVIEVDLVEAYDEIVKWYRRQPAEKRAAMRAALDAAAARMTEYVPPTTSRSRRTKKAKVS